MVKCGRYLKWRCTGALSGGLRAILSAWIAISRCSTARQAASWVRASLGGSAPSWAVRLPTCAMSTATAMPTTIRRRMGAFARARDSFALPVIANTFAIRAHKEGRCNARPCGRKYAPRRYRSPLLAWRRFRRSLAFHCRCLSGCRTSIASRAGCP